MSTLTPVQAVFARVHSPTSLTFPEVVASLLKLGVTRYHVDYISRTTTTYTPKKATSSTDAETISTEQIAIPAPSAAGVKPSTAWDAAALTRALRRVQAGETVYAEFAREVVDAGVTGYFAFLEGKRVLYYGLNGDVYVEWFPGAGPAKQEE
ncbi:uncharacterized protein Z520_10180 [Fonsecaea multimorphosa CBS 102226]|uniref:DUF1398 domain-containing protein n=1 Tax=Fonsecaea multimorphosa CBS 102226 TaxID=1442371 RepID=A0A0D2JUG5_9EURO|nr:uncharacterized protein Z520_10180 [Fonsecaea multimorphosa CBS 102226]KIX94154.1 hypothetical protein Z520_10180 [Fonsecaea multimorphosa CBS 102226]OAL19507.1 hypothetical protein AYO22_09669 [Fonsecaea multimorphosa]